LRGRKHLPSKKGLAVILAVIIIALTVVDYQLYHGPILPGGRYDFRSTHPFTPDITIPVLTSTFPQGQTTSLENSNPSTGISVMPSNTLDQSTTFPKIGIYSNNPSSNTPQPLNMIDWSTNGPIMPGQTVNSSTVYLRNEGTTTIALSFSTSDWSFEDVNGKFLLGNYSTYFALTWDYDNTSITVNEIRPITFSISISPEIKDVSEFSFNLLITSFN
jgi:hypothetical protein